MQHQQVSTYFVVCNLKREVTCKKQSSVFQSRICKMLHCHFSAALSTVTNHLLYINTNFQCFLSAAACAMSPWNWRCSKAIQPVCFHRNERLLYIQGGSFRFRGTSILAESSFVRKEEQVLQFLNAPTRLALLMKFFKRSWSISAKPDVWVTTVRWFMQNRKQNSSKS